MQPIFGSAGVPARNKNKTTTDMEIEHKYVIIDDSWRDLAVSSHHICQGYLSQETGCTVRVRTYDDKAFITIKGESSTDGLSREEFEYPIPHDDALRILKLCKNSIIEKQRYIIPVKGSLTIAPHDDEEPTTQILDLKIEVDIFEGDNKGLRLAELEVPDKRVVLLDPPAFLGEEVTGIVRYYNSFIAQHPYHTWF